MRRFKSKFSFWVPRRQGGWAIRSGLGLYFDVFVDAKVPSMYLDVNHEKAPDTPVNNAGSSTTSHISWIPSAIDPYSDKLIVQ